MSLVTKTWKEGNEYVTVRWIPGEDGIYLVESTISGTTTTYFSNYAEIQAYLNRRTMNKNDILWFVFRLILTGLSVSICYDLINLANTVVNLIGLAGLLAIGYYWLPTDKQIEAIKKELL